VAVCFCYAPWRSRSFQIESSVKILLRYLLIIFLFKIDLGLDNLLLVVVLGAFGSSIKRETTPTSSVGVNKGGFTLIVAASSYVKLSRATG